MDFYRQMELCGRAYNMVVTNLGRIPEDKKDEANRLLRQFHYGIAARKELLQLCIEIGLISEKD